MKETVHSGNFKPGHPRFGGRKKGSQNKRTREVQEILDRLDFHPVEFLAIVASTGQMPNPDGSFTAVDAVERLGAAKAIAPFCAPRLQAVEAQVNGIAEPQLSVVLPTTQILSDPKLCDALNDLALLVAQQGMEDGPRQCAALPPSVVHALNIAGN